MGASASREGNDDEPAYQDPADPIRTKVERALPFCEEVELESTREVTILEFDCKRVLLPVGASATEDGKPPPAPIELLVGWRATNGSLVLAFKQSKVVQQKIDENQEMEVPCYMASLWGKDWGEQTPAKVIGGLDGILDFNALRQLIDGITGKHNGAPPVRRITTLGYSTGGVLAVLAAPWAGLDFPSADIRCITFDAPLWNLTAPSKFKICNDEFMIGFKWLVGFSFDVKYCEVWNRRGRLDVGLQVRSTWGDYNTIWQLERIQETEFESFQGMPSAILESLPSSGLQATQPDPGIKLLAHYIKNVKKQEVPFSEVRSKKIAKLASRPKKKFSQKLWIGVLLVWKRTWNTVDWLISWVKGALGWVVQLFFKEQKEEDKVGNLNEVTVTLQKTYAYKGVLKHKWEVDLKSVIAASLLPAAQWAKAAYAWEREFRHKVGVKDAVLISNDYTDAQGYVAVLGDEHYTTAVLCFRGTTSISDWRYNFNFQPDAVSLHQKLEHYPGKIHGGFTAQFHSLLFPELANSYKGITFELDKLLAKRGVKEPERVICMGHSLGGALATLGAMWASFQYPHADIQCFTFGAPHVGDRRFVENAQLVLGSYIRAVHGGDIVPTLLHLLKFEQMQPAIYLQDGDLKFEKQQRELVLHWVDHDMTNYINALKDYQSYAVVAHNSEDDDE